MTINNINVEEVVERVKTQIAAEKELSPALKASLDLMLVLVTLLLNRLGLNSSNSSKPPSADPNRLRKTRSKSDRKPGGQQGHCGTTLQPVAEPDEIKIIQIDRNSLPQGQYHEVGYESRQVIDLDIARVVTEWRAQMLVALRKSQKWRWWRRGNRYEDIGIHCRHLFRWAEISLFADPV